MNDQELQALEKWQRDAKTLAQKIFHGLVELDKTRQRLRRLKKEIREWRNQMVTLGLFASDAQKVLGHTNASWITEF